jgi:hypothetical protein
MTDIVRDLLFRASDQEGIGWTPTTVVPVPTGLLHRAADDIKRLNRELDDVWDALVIQREDNASFGDAFKRMTSEIERLRAALGGMLRAVCGPDGFAAAIRQTSGMAYPWPALDAAEREARAALAQEKQDV